MPRIENSLMVIMCDADGQNLTLVDKRRGVSWLLDQKTLVIGTALPPVQREELIPIAAQKTFPNTIDVTLKAGEVKLILRIRMLENHSEWRVTAPSASDIQYFSMPGAFIPEGNSFKLLLPIMQGMLWDGRGQVFDIVRGEASHTGFSMPFVGYLADKGGLLVVSETYDDCQWWLGKESSGRFWAVNLQLASLGSMRYPRVLRIYPTDPDIVAVAKRYRQYVKQIGRFVSWEEKIEQRPNLERLFGALMCFIGYCQDDDLDYLGSFQKLKAYGFDRALVYPARFNSYDKDIIMGGQPAIHLSREQVESIKSLGYDVAPWSWLNERLDDKTGNSRFMLRRDALGRIMEHWAIDDQQWYHVCYSFIEEIQKQALCKKIADMTWDHFDVLACMPPQECYALDHNAHRGRPMSRSESRDYVRRTFDADKKSGLAVSSENFNDAYACEYDIGSVKAWPQYGPWPFWPVPLTMLVYHDSMMHSWWEVHNYNSPWFGRTRAPAFFEYGGGRPKLMAALDALMGCPPDVFPFGAQYGWTGRGKETFLYRYRFEDPEVQIALREALPVAHLHRRIGKLEMIDFEILSEDGYIQATTFADGTRIMANFSRDVFGETPGIGHVDLGGVGAIMPESWKIVA
jgi:hypothetical protein